MYLLDQRIFGFTILFLLGILVIVKQAATGSVLDKPKGSFLVQLVNIYNLFFLLVVNPLAAILLITRRLVTIDPTRIIVHGLWLSVVIEIIGMATYITGYFIMAWALVTLGRNYQLGGSTPRDTDEIVMAGPYRFLRHPMYLAALCISLGLALLTKSLGFFAVFCVYLVFILFLIPIEEEEMLRTYNERFIAYSMKAKKIIPFLY
jgi:protein-S-isoprenylcysteine O-methyltransferase Ste14